MNGCVCASGKHSGSLCVFVVSIRLSINHYFSILLCSSHSSSGWWFWLGTSRSRSKLFFLICQIESGAANNCASYRPTIIIIGLWELCLF